MKYQIFAAFLVITLMSAGSVQAVGPNAAAGTGTASDSGRPSMKAGEPNEAGVKMMAPDGEPLPIRIEMQKATGTPNQIQTQTQTQERVQLSSSTSDKVKVQEKAMLNTGTSTAERGAIQARGQQKTSGEIAITSQAADQESTKGNQVRAQVKEQSENTEETNSTAEQRRSQVANAVQQMLQIADRNGGLGEQIRSVAQAQTENQEKLESGLQKVQSRGALAKFFFGPDYSAISSAEKILEQNRAQISQLTSIEGELSDAADVSALDEQIVSLTQANAAIAESLQEAQDSFSVLGWMFRLFAK